MSLYSIPSLQAGGVEKPRKPVALKNIGNSCFMNAAVQVVFAMHDLTSLALAQCNDYRKGSLAQTYCNLIPTLMHSDIPKDGLDLSALCFLGWHQLNEFPGKQADAGEFLVELLECLTNKDLEKSSLQEPLDEELHIDLLQLLEVNTAHLSTMYILGLEQNYQNITQRESSIHLSLPIEDSHTMLEEVLQSYFKTTDTPTCYTPAGHSVIQKQRTILEKTSPYVICTLNRTDYVKMEKQEASSSIRRNNPISFSLYERSFTQYFSDKDLDKEFYELIGIIMHNGTASSGHYTAYVKSGNQWYYCNDETIKPMNELEVFEIAQQGHGVAKNTIPTTLVYERSATRAKCAK